MADEKKERKIETNEERSERILHDPSFWDDYKTDDEYEAKWSPAMEKWAKDFVKDENAVYDENEEDREKE